MTGRFFFLPLLAMLSLALYSNLLEYGSSYGLETAEINTLLGYGSTMLLSFFFINGNASASLIATAYLTFVCACALQQYPGEFFVGIVLLQGTVLASHLLHTAFILLARIIRPKSPRMAKSPARKRPGPNFTASIGKTASATEQSSNHRATLAVSEAHDKHSLQQQTPVDLSIQPASQIEVQILKDELAASRSDYDTRVATLEVNNKAPAEFVTNSELKALKADVRDSLLAHQTSHADTRTLLGSLQTSMANMVTAQDAALEQRFKAFTTAQDSDLDEKLKMFVAKTVHPIMEKTLTRLATRQSGWEMNIELRLDRLGRTVVLLKKGLDDLGEQVTDGLKICKTGSENLNTAEFDMGLKISALERDLAAHIEHFNCNSRSLSEDLRKQVDDDLEEFKTGFKNSKATQVETASKISALERALDAQINQSNWDMCSLSKVKDDLEECKIGFKSSTASQIDMSRTISALERGLAAHVEKSNHDSRTFSEQIAALRLQQAPAATVPSKCSPASAPGAVPEQVSAFRAAASSSARPAGLSTAAQSSNPADIDFASLPKVTSQSSPLPPRTASTKAIREQTPATAPAAAPQQSAPSRSPSDVKSSEAKPRTNSKNVSPLAAPAFGPRPIAVGLKEETAVTPTPLSCSSTADTTTPLAQGQKPLPVFTFSKAPSQLSAQGLGTDKTTALKGLSAAGASAPSRPKAAAKASISSAPVDNIASATKTASPNSASSLAPGANQGANGKRVLFDGPAASDLKFSQSAANSTSFRFRGTTSNQSSDAMQPAAGTTPQEAEPVNHWQPPPNLNALTQPDFAFLLSPSGRSAPSNTPKRRDEKANARAKPGPRRCRP